MHLGGGQCSREPTTLLLRQRREYERSLHASLSASSPEYLGKDRAVERHNASATILLLEYNIEA